MSEHPHDRAGTEPINARSPLRLRLILATVATVVTLVAAALLALAGADDSDPGGLLVAAGFCLVVAVVSAVDAAQVARRLRRGDHG